MADDGQVTSHKWLRKFLKPKLAGLTKGAETGLFEKGAQKPKRRKKKYLPIEEETVEQPAQQPSKPASPSSRVVDL